MVAAAACTSGPPPPDDSSYADDDCRAARDQRPRVQRKPTIPCRQSGATCCSRSATIRPIRPTACRRSCNWPTSGRCSRCRRPPAQMRRLQLVGALEFTLHGQPLSLGALSPAGEPIRNLFVPFADLTTGKETYPAGRYLDIQPTSTGIYTIDFNYAYNPYCAYNASLRVPVPAAVEPAEGPDPRRRKGARRMTGALQAIVFDFDGVIADSEPLHLRAFQQALAEDGIELTSHGLLRALSRLRRRRDVPGAGAGPRHRDERPAVTALVARKGASCRRCCRPARCCFPARRSSSARRPRAVPIAIASGALRHEIDEIIEAAGCRATSSSTIVASGDTPREQAVAGAVPAGVRAAARRTPARTSIRALRGDRGFALGARIGARRRVTLCRSDQQLPGRRAARRRAGRRRA